MASGSSGDRKRRDFEIFSLHPPASTVNLETHDEKQHPKSIVFLSNPSGIPPTTNEIFYGSKKVRT